MGRKYPYCIPSEQADAMQKRKDDPSARIKNLTRFDVEKGIYERRTRSRGSEVHLQSLILFVLGRKTYTGNQHEWIVFFGPDSTYNVWEFNACASEVVGATVEALVNAIKQLDTLLENQSFILDLTIVIDEPRIYRALTDWHCGLGNATQLPKVLFPYWDELMHIHYALLSLSNSWIECKLWLGDRSTFSAASEWLSRYKMESENAALASSLSPPTSVPIPSISQTKAPPSTSKVSHEKLDKTSTQIDSPTSQPHLLEADSQQNLVTPAKDTQAQTWSILVSL